MMILYRRYPKSEAPYPIPSGSHISAIWVFVPVIVSNDAEIGGDDA